MAEESFAEWLRRTHPEDTPPDSPNKAGDAPVDTDTITGIMAGIPKLLKAVPELLNHLPQGVKAIGERVIDAAPYAALVPALAQGDPSADAMLIGLHKQRQDAAQRAQIRQGLQLLAQQHNILQPGEALPAGVEDVQGLAALYKIEHPTPEKPQRLGKPGEQYTLGGKVYTVPGGEEKAFKNAAEAEGYIAKQGWDAPRSAEAKAFLESDTQRRLLIQRSGQQSGAEIRNQFKDTSAKDASRLDRSFGVQNTQLTNFRKPVADQLERMGRLVDSINQQTPQADALIAPELLTAMAGGAGSGLRINRSEIENAVGGKNNWEKLKSKVAAWQTDPTKPIVFLPEQRRQAAALIEVMHAKILRKLSIIDRAFSDLAEADSIESQRRVVNQARKKLDLLTGKAKVLPAILKGGAASQKPETAPDVINLNE